MICPSFVLWSTLVLQRALRQKIIQVGQKDLQWGHLDCMGLSTSSPCEFFRSALAFRVNYVCHRGWFAGTG